MLHYIKAFNIGCVFGAIIIYIVKTAPSLFTFYWALLNVVSFVVISFVECIKEYKQEKNDDQNFGFRPEDIKKLREALNKTDPLTMPVCNKGGPTLLEILKLLDSNSPAPDHCDECRRFYNQLRDEECNKK